MNALRLLASAKRAGLEIRTEERDRLVVRGPRVAEALALEVLAQKTGIISLLPAEPCPSCRGAKWWLSVQGEYSCSACTPPSSPDRIALTHTTRPRGIPITKADVPAIVQRLGGPGTRLIRAAQVGGHMVYEYASGEDWWSSRKVEGTEE